MALSRCITAQNPKIGSSYPEGNFGGNQLLGGSMSLSPLYRALTNDLHVSTAMPTSIAVSSDFVVARYSSPPFGSLCEYSRSTGVTLTSCRRPLRANAWFFITFTCTKTKGFPNILFDFTTQVWHESNVSPTCSHSQRTPWPVFQDGRHRVSLSNEVFNPSSVFS